MIRTVVRSAAGELDATWEAVRTGSPCFRPCPWPTDGLKTPLAAWIDHLPRDRPAEHLLLRGLLELLGDRDLRRTGLVVATTSGNIAGVFEAAHRAELAGTPVEAVRPGRDGPTLAARPPFGGPVTTLSLACISGTAAFTVAEGWLADGLCDEVAVVGVDAVCPYVQAGFSGLGALSASLPRPFTDAHDGMLLGEAFAGVLLGREGDLYAAGTGLASDALHATAPDREGRGALRAALDALKRADVGPDDIVAVSPHGTGTPFADAMEAHVLRTLFPEPRPVQLVKAMVGHTLGAAGVLEAAVALRSLQGVDGAVLSLSSAFGGMNASVVLSRWPGLAPEPRVVRVDPARAHDVPLAEAWPDAPVTASRYDRYVQTGLGAIVAEHLREPLPPTTALVLASRTNCAIMDRAHHRRIVEEGYARASRRAFVDTLPAAPLAAASIALGLRGPLLAFVDDPDRATEEAARLVRHGYADQAVAVALEVPTPEAPILAHTTRVRA
ncbi:MAG: hypothetical protein KC656_03920 [Myxococcales bacterium]|nr:hypothetical protein [Myxococcales bacterium]